MAGVELIAVDPDEDGMRVDRCIRKSAAAGGRVRPRNGGAPAIGP